MDIAWEEPIDAEITLATEYDTRLEMAIEEGGKAPIPFTKTLAGWEVEEMKGTLECAQYGEAVMKLPWGAGGIRLNKHFLNLYWSVLLADVELSLTKKYVQSQFCYIENSTDVISVL
jgi:hypothetical protein